MKARFSIKRTALLLQRYFVENLTYEIMFFCSLIFIFTILDHQVFVITSLFLSGLIYSLRMQRELFKGSNGVQFLLIPAKPSEKLVTILFLNTFYLFAIVILSYSIGNILITLVYHYLLRIEIPVNWDVFQYSTTVFAGGVLQATVKNVFWSVFGYFSMSQAIFLVGILYFQKHALIKTIISILLVIALIFLTQLVLFKSFWEVKYLSNAIYPTILMLASESALPRSVTFTIDYGCYLLTPLFWLISYFRLKEKEM